MNRSAITIRLSNNELTGSDQLFLTKTQINKIKNAKPLNKGVDIKISKTQVRHAVKEGGSLFTSLMSLGTKMLPMAMKLASKALPGLATGALSSLGTFGMDKILRRGQEGGFLIPLNKINQLIEHKNLLTKKQKEQILSALQTGGQLVIKPAKAQSGGFVGTLLASISVPLLLNALTGKGLRNRKPPTVGDSESGSGLRNQPYNMLMQYQPPPFIGSWSNPSGSGIKKKEKKKKGKRKTGRGLLLGKSSPFNGILSLGALLLSLSSLINHYLIMI